MTTETSVTDANIKAYTIWFDARRDAATNQNLPERQRLNRTIVALDQVWVKRASQLVEGHKG